MARSASSRPLRSFFTALLTLTVTASPIFSLPPVKGAAHLARRSAASSAAVPQALAPHKAGELIVKFHQGAAQALRQQILDTYAKSHKELRHGNSGLPVAGGVMPRPVSR
jgi:hypothetical protein